MSLLQRIDTRIFYWLFSLTQNRGYAQIKWLSKTGDGHLYLVLGILLWAFEPQDGHIFIYTALLAYAIELPIYLVMKKSFKRQRPCDLIKNFKAHIQPSDKFSLPSGHTTAAFLMASLVSFYYPSLFIIAYGWASLIGLSRVLLGVHYPTDVIIGALLGISLCQFTLLIY